MKLLLLILCLVLLAAVQTSARTWYVKSDGTGDAATIQAGLDSAWAGDTIRVAGGTYFEHDVRIKSGVTLRSETGHPDCATIDAQEQGGVIYCEDADSTTSIEGFTISHGNAVRGGGLSLLRSPIRLSRCIVSDNRAEHGGGVSVSLSDARIEECQFIGNSADVSGPDGYFAGGGAVCYQCSPVFVDVEFRANRGGLPPAYGNMSGGAVWIYGPNAVPRFTRCTFEDNFIGGWTGGAMSIYAGATPEIVECVFRHNQGGNGGAIYVGTNWFRAERTVFEANSSGRGGAICMGSGGTGGSLVGCTVVGNTDSRPEGASVWVNSTGGPCNIDQTIIAYATQGSAVRCDEGGSVILACCDVYGNAGGDWVGYIADQCSVNGNFSVCPSFCNGDLDDFHLCDESPCLPGNHPYGYDCGLIGAWGLGCSCGPTRTESTTWGAIKSMYK